MNSGGITRPARGTKKPPLRSGYSAPAGGVRCFMDDRDLELSNEILALVNSYNFEIRWKVEPKGKEGGIIECIEYNSFLLSTVKRLVEDLNEFYEQLSLEQPLYIVNTVGSSRDDFGIGIGYPKDLKVERDLNMRSKAKDIIAFAKELPIEQQEDYLQGFRDSGWKGYV